jgi:hypothetical protein
MMSVLDFWVLKNNNKGPNGAGIILIKINRENNNNFCKT